MVVVVVVLVFLILILIVILIIIIAILVILKVVLVLLIIFLTWAPPAISFGPDLQELEILTRMCLASKSSGGHEFSGVGASG